MLAILGGLVLVVKLLLSMTNAVKNALHQARWRRYTGPDCEGQLPLCGKHPETVGSTKPQTGSFFKQLGNRRRIDHIINHGGTGQAGKPYQRARITIHAKRCGIDKCIDIRQTLFQLIEARYDCQLGIGEPGRHGGGEF